MTTPTFVGDSLEEQLQRETAAMASYALMSGQPVPGH